MPRTPRGGRRGRRRERVSERTSVEIRRERRSEGSAGSSARRVTTRGPRRFVRTGARKRRSGRRGGTERARTAPRTKSVVLLEHRLHRGCQRVDVPLIKVRHRPLVQVPISKRRIRPRRHHGARPKKCCQGDEFGIDHEQGIVSSVSDASEILFQDCSAIRSSRASRRAPTGPVDSCQIDTVHPLTWGGGIAPRAACAGAHSTRTTSTPPHHT